MIKSTFGSGSDKVSALLVNSAYVGYKTVTKRPNLVWGDPEGYISMLRCIRAWGGAPFPNAPRSPNVPLGKYSKSHSGPLQPRPTHTPSRRCAPCSLACFHFFFRELPLLTRPHLTQPLLLTFETAGKSAFPSPYDVSVAAARQDICTISRQLNKPCRCHPTACARFDPCTC